MTKIRDMVDVIERWRTAGYLLVGEIIIQADIKARVLGKPTIVDKN
jgi:hypothetical protein